MEKEERRNEGRDKTQNKQNRKKRVDRENIEKEMKREGREKGRGERETWRVKIEKQRQRE